ncbi:hypothetical protein CLV71_101141 [Actinophytocola oryzae]|uniref:Tetracyclin repressor-like C-terminal domain-containing protein n=2 Tax=Actinophytocola oryzae TaxID=502181 RepID=A0A4R7W3N2_9PSEU|nr:hypothetical protein CLV71_101141 [Actinophytocola oryzae]
MPWPPAGECTWAASPDLRLPDLSATPREEVGRRIARHVLDRCDGDETLMALLRASVTNPAAAQRTREIFATQLGPAVVAIAPDDAAARAGLVAAQVLGLGLALTRYVLRLPPIVAMDRDTVVDWLAPTLQHYLTGTRRRTG